MNNLTRLLLTTASVTALVISAQTAHADSVTPVQGSGSITYGTGGAVIDTTGEGGGLKLTTVANDTVTLDSLSIAKTVPASATAGPASALEIDNTTGTLTVNLSTQAATIYQSSDQAAALTINNSGTGLTTLDTSVSSGVSGFFGTQGLVVLGGGDVSVTTKNGDLIQANGNGGAFTSENQSGGNLATTPGGYSAGIFASGAGNVTIINGATIETDGAGDNFDAGIAAFGANITVTNTATGNVTGTWAGVLGESGSGNLTVNNNGTISSNGSGVEQLGSGTLTVHNYGTGVIQAAGGSGTGEGIGIVSYSNTPLNVTNDAGGFVVGSRYGIEGNNAADSIDNSGTIASGTYSGTVTVGEAAGINLDDGGTIVNRGGATIEGRGGVSSSGSTIINNAGTISATTDAGVQFLADDNALTNDSTGQIVGGSSDDGIYLGAIGGVANTTINNYGSITGGTGGIGGASATPSTVTINLFAGSTTGDIDLSSDAGSSVVSLYTGMGTANTGLTDTATGSVEQANGTLAAAAYGNITGATGNVLALRGSGDGTAANGVAGQIDLSSAPSNATGIISGFATIEKDDSGTWQFLNAAGDAATNQSPTIVLNQGAIDATAVGAFGGGAINVNGNSTIEFGATGDYGNAITLNIASPTAANALTLSADSGVTANVTAIPSSAIAGQSIIINGNGTVVLGGTETYTGTTTIANGTLSLGTAGDISASSAVNLTSSSAILNVSSSAATPTINALAGVSGSGVVMGAQGLTVNANNATSSEFDGTISQNAAGGNFTKSGNGTLILGGFNSYTDATYISGGTLGLGFDGSIASSASVHLTDASSVLDASSITGPTPTIHNLTGVTGSNVKFGAKGLTVAESGATTFAGTISGAGGANGTLTINGGGDLTLTGQNTYTADTIVSNNTTLSLGDPNSSVDVSNVLVSGANVTVTDTSTLYMDIYGGHQKSVSQTFGNVTLGTSGVPGGTLNIAESAQATINYLSMTGGHVIASGEGGTLLNVETLSGDSNSTITVGGTTFNLGANGTASSYAGALTINDSGIFNAGTLTFNGTLHASEGGTFTATTFNQTGGTVTFDGGYFGGPGVGSGNVTTYNLSAGSLAVEAGETAGGSLTAGTFNQTGGSVYLAAGGYNFGGNLNATTYNMSNGFLTVESGEVAGGGVLTATTFNQTGGNVILDQGETAGGTLNATTYAMSGGNLIVGGGEGTAGGNLTATTFNQTGGNITIFGGEHSSGTLTATTFNQSAGTILLEGETNYPALFNAVTFNQTGGALDIEGGNVTIGTLTGSGGTIDICGCSELFVGSGNTTSTYGGDISGSGYIEKDGTGTLTLAGDNSSFNGDFDVEGGTLQAGSATAFGDSEIRVATNGTVDANGYSQNFYRLENDGVVTDSSTTAATLTMQRGEIGGTIQDGAGKLSIFINEGGLYNVFGGSTLSYSGATTISNGAYAYFGNDGAPNSVLNNYGTVDLSYSTSANVSFASLAGTGAVYMGGNKLVLNNANGMFSGVLQDGGENGGTGASLEIAAGREVLTGANTYTGGTLIDAGAVLQLGDGGTTGSVTGVPVDNGTIAFDRTAPATITQTIAGTGGLEVDSVASITLTGVQPTLAGASLIEAGGKLALSGAGTLDVPLTDEGTFDISAASGDRTIQSLAGDGTVVLGANTLTLGTANDTFFGTINGTGGLTTSGGTETLSGANTYTGATTIGAGSTLALAGNGTVATSSGVADAGTFDISATTAGATVNAFAGAGNLVLGGQTLTIANAAGTFSGVASGTGGGLTIAGGTETLSGADTYTGPTTIASGATLALAGNGSLASSDIVDAGTLDISGTTNGTRIASLDGSGTIFLGSKTLTFVDADGAFSGNITDGGDNGSVVIASGTQTLTGDNTYGGGTTVQADSTLIVNSPESLGTGTITFGPDSTIQFTAGGTYTQNAVFEAAAPIYDVGASTVTWAGTMSGAGDLAVTGNGGTLVLTNTANSYTGGTEVYGGSTLNIGADSELGGVAALQLGDATTAGTLQLADSFDLNSGRTLTVNAGGGVIDTQAFSTTVAQAIAGAGGLTKQGSGTLVLAANNTYSGPTTVANGTVQIGNGGTTGSVAGDIADNSAVAFDRSDAVTYGGVVSGTGTLAQAGSGTLTLTGTNTLTGATAVNAGTLLVNGSLGSSAVTVNSGATLGGTGTVGSTTIASGGTVSPGAGGAGTLSVNGNLSLASGSNTNIDVTPTTAEKIAVSGSAALGGTLNIAAAAGTYTSGTDYTIVSASSVSGTFATLNDSIAGYVTTVNYSPTAVTFDIASGTGPSVVTYAFSAYGVTPNQIAAGAALEAADPSGALYGAVGTAVTSNPAAAPGELNQLTGELHASARSALIEDGRAIRESVLDHLAQDPDGMTAWATGFASDGRIDATSNTGALHHTNGGFIGGVDTPISDWSPDLRVGLAGAYNADHASISGSGSTLHGSTGHVVAYAGWTGGPWAAKGGVDLGWGNIHVTRDVDFLGETEHSSQSTRTTQVFGDVGYDVSWNTLALQPYADLAYINAKTGGFAETGGLAALSGNGSSDDVTYSTLGARVSLTSWSMGDGGWTVTPRADIGWQHAFSRVNPYDAVAFNDNGEGFAVAGAPLDEDAAAVQGGVDIAITPQAVISLTYDGTFSSKVKNNTFRGGFIWKF